MLRQHDIQDLVDRLERDGTHRVLRKLDVAEGRTGVPYHGGDTFIAVVLDVETTGLDATKDVVIELAVRRFRYDKAGRILKIDASRSWFEDPGRPLDAEVTRLTVRNAIDVRGCDRPARRSNEPSGHPDLLRCARAGNGVERGARKQRPSVRGRLLAASQPADS